MDPRLLAPGLYRRADRRFGTHGRQLFRARAARRFLVHVTGLCARRLPQPLCGGLPHQQRGHSPGQGLRTMTSCALDRQHGMTMSAAKILGLALLLLAAAAGSRAAVTPPAGSAAATTLARDSARCR